MSSHDEHDPLSELLRDVAIPPNNPDRREAIFAQTRGVLWRRRFLRRTAWSAALAACYAIGALSVLAWQSTHPDNPLAQQQDAATDVHHIPSTQETTLKKPNESFPEAGLLQREIVEAERAPAYSLTTFEKLRRAGDRQLNERGNLQGALGCYRRALDYASDDELQIAPERDSWLLIPLKEARLETRKHVHKKT